MKTMIYIMLILLLSTFLFFCACSGNLTNNGGETSMVPEGSQETLFEGSSENEDTTINPPETTSNKIYKVANFRTVKAYSSNMVIQQNKPVTFVGYCDPGHTIEVRLYDGIEVIRETSCVSNEEGTWSCEFEGVEASYKEYTLSFFTDGQQTAKYKSILFGEVWLAAGQSNMQWWLHSDFHLNDVKYDKKYVRALVMSEPTYTYDPVMDNDTLHWVTGDTKNILESSGVGYYFAAKLQEKLDIPVGILCVAKGGSTLSAWISRETYKENEVLQRMYKTRNCVLSEEQWEGYAREQTMSAVYNSWLAPTMSLKAAGVIWYQGESDYGYTQYSTQLEILHKQFCKDYGFEGEDMPWVMCQIAPYY